MHVDEEVFPKKLGKFPDYLVKGLNKPGIVSGKIKGAIGLGRILYKTGAWKRVGRYYGFKYRKKIGVAVSGGVIAGGLSSVPWPSTKDGETRNYMVKPSTRRKYGTKHNNCTGCRPC